MEQEAIQHKWYVVRVKGGQEKKISTYIEKEVNRLDWNEYVTLFILLELFLSLLSPYFLQFQQPFS